MDEVITLVLTVISAVLMGVAIGYGICDEIWCRRVSRHIEKKVRRNHEETK